MRINKIKKLAYLSPYLFVFISSLYYAKDPDLGWHLKYGEYFITHHEVLRHNIYSSLMPGFYWANGSWGSDVIIYLLFHYGGFLGLTIAGAAIVSLTFFIYSKAARLTFFQQSILFPAILFLTYPVNSVSLRGQQISLLFIGILFFIISRYTPFSKKIFWVFPLFLFWSNIHEQSILGISIFGSWVLWEAIKTRQVQHTKFLFVVFVVSFLLTLFNPFRIDIYKTALSHLFDNQIKSVSEYVPFAVSSLRWFVNVIYTFFALGTIIYLYSIRKFKEDGFVIVVSLLFLFFSFLLQRFVWSSYYIGLLLFAVPSRHLESQLRKLSFFVGSIIVLVGIVGFGGQRIAFGNFADMNWEKYCQMQQVKCSANAANFILAKQLNAKLFTYYDWGGWLIWNFPKIKPSIDGRMHVWRDERGYSATEEYYKYQNAIKSIDNSEFDAAFIPLDNSPIYYELDRLMREGKWSLVYEDSLAGVVVRNKK